MASPLPSSRKLAGGMFSPDPRVHGLQKGCFIFFPGAVRQEQEEGEQESIWRGTTEGN